MNSFKSRFVSLVGLSGAAYLLSFCSQILISYYFGTSSALDAYWLAYAIANTLCFFVVPLREALVPVVFTTAQRDTRQAERVLTAGLVLSILFACLATVVLLVFPHQLLSIGSGQPTLMEETARLFPFLVPFLFLFTLAEICNSLMLSFDMAMRQTAVRLLSAAGGIACLVLLGRSLGVAALIISLWLAQGLTLAASWRALRAKGLNWAWSGWKHIWHPKASVMFGALLLNYLFSQGYVLYERWALSHAATGVLSAYQYSVSLVNVLISMLAFPMINLLWPHFLDTHAKSSPHDFTHLVFRHLANLCVMLLACSVFLMHAAPDVVRVLLAQGAFGEKSIAMTAHALQLTALAAVPIGLNSMVVRCFLTQGRARAVALFGIVTALAGVLVISAGVLGQNVAVIQSHWLIANTVGVVLAIVLMLRTSQESIVSALSRGGFWALRLVAGVSVAAWLCPQFTWGTTRITLLFQLGLEFIIYAIVGCTALVGLQILRRQMFVQIWAALRARLCRLSRI